MKKRTLIISFMVLALSACSDSVSKDGNNSNNVNNANNANNSNNGNNSNNANNANNSNNGNNSNNANSSNNANNTTCEQSYDGTCGGVWCVPEKFEFVCTPGETLVCTCTTDGASTDVDVTEAVDCSQQNIHLTANSLCEWELPAL